MTIMEYLPFHASAPDEDPAALRRRMDEDGYLFVRGLIPRADIAALRRQTLAMAAEAGWLQGDPDASVANQAAACVDPEADYLRVFKPMYRLEALHALAHAPAVLRLLEGLLEAP